MAVRNKRNASHVEPAEFPAAKQSRIFISHDSRDAEIAEVFSDLLSDVSAGMLRSFRSSDRKGAQGIAYGSEWYEELKKHLQAASDVVCLMTERSLERPWVLFEAGVAVGKLGTPVLGVALGIPLSQASTGPFALMQNCAGDEESLTSLVLQLMDRIPDAKPARRIVKERVRAFTKKTSRILTRLDGDEADKSSRPARFEEFMDLGMDMVHDRLSHKNLKERLEGSEKIRVLKTWFPESKVIGNGLRSAITKQHAKVRLLLCKPGSSILKCRSLGAHEEAWWGSHKVYQAIKDVHKWVQEAPNAQVEIACYDSWPGCPVIWYDESVLMGFYFRGDSSPEWPWVSVKPGTRLATILDDQFNELWRLSGTVHLDTRKQRASWLKKNRKWGMSQTISLRRQKPGKSSNRIKPRRKDKA